MPEGQATPLTVSQARQALDEASVASQAEALTENEVEISTNFTIGDAVETAAQNLRDFITSQLPCAGITLSGATLSIQYGANPGNCTYRGQTFSGKTSVTIAKNDSGDVEVKHHWDGFSNGKVSVTGDATVTWSLNDKTRHVVHTATWTRVSDGLTATGSGDRTQQPLAGGILEGFQVDGSRSWSGQSRAVGPGYRRRADALGRSGAPGRQLHPRHALQEERQPVVLARRRRHYPGNRGEREQELPLQRYQARNSFPVGVTGHEAKSN